MEHAEIHCKCGKVYETGLQELTYTYDPSRVQSKEKAVSPCPKCYRLWSRDIPAEEKPKRVIHVKAGG